VILRCLGADQAGAIAPLDGSAAADVRSQAAGLRAQGYRVRLGLTLADATLDPSQASALVERAAFQQAVAAGVPAWLDGADGLELQLPQLVNTATSGVDALVAALDAAVRPAHPLGVFVPPSVMDPSDLAGGAAYDLAALAPHVGRVRVMTLDFSCCGAPPGPTIDATWATDAIALARGKLAGVPLDVAAPLYGWDFGAAATPIGFADASALAADAHASIAREADGAEHFAYRDPSGAQHQVWFEDAQSIAELLAAWAPPALPADVGVLYYGLGAEDPRTWTMLAGGAR
jgi:spore germination protein YaaH